MNAYNPNYFNRSNVNSMKNALRKIIVSEQFRDSEEGQPGMSISGISNLELQKRMRNKKNTSIFNKNPKQSDEYLELEREFNRRNTPQQQAPMSAMPVGQQPTQPTQPTQPIGSSIPGSGTPPDPNGLYFGTQDKGRGPDKFSRVGKPVPQEQAIQAQELHQFNRPGGVTIPATAPSRPTMPASGQGAYSSTDTGSAKRGIESDIAAGYESVFGSFGKRSSYDGKPIQNQEKIPPSVDPDMIPQTPMTYGDDPEAAAAYDRRAIATQLAKRKNQFARNQMRTRIKLY